MPERAKKYLYLRHIKQVRNLEYYVTINFMADPGLLVLSK
jgi:hypothetical protein